MKVALATQDMFAVNAHFAGARTLAIYDVTPAGWSLVEAVQFDDASAEDGAGHDDDRVAPRVAALDGCTLLFVRAIGGPAAARVVGARVHPIKLPDDAPLEQVLQRVRTMLNGTPPPWLRKAMGGEGGRRPAFLDEDAETGAEA
ncbi:nitrogen fixation protein NifX [Roseospira goensis]|uniref:Nitrogen fixation protein NifX n=1 Tax=Roseospira goensis TaxID=391922 RepID=A0A7W6S0X7_9PROT|nr:nitrogen fixation protein NifX [Roseospira goensis]